MRVDFAESEKDAAAGRAAAESKGSASMGMGMGMGMGSGMGMGEPVDKPVDVMVCAIGQRILPIASNPKAIQHPSTANTSINC